MVMPEGNTHPATAHAEYERFVARAASGLVAAGAQVMLPTPDGRPAAEWTTGWDRILLSSTPGSHALYAFTDAGSQSGGDIQTRLDRLAQGVAASGLSLQPSLRLIAIVAFPGGVPEHRPGRVTRLAPRTFYAGLRPATWAADLPAQRLYSGRRWRAEGADVVGNALSSASGEVLDADRMSAVQALHQQRAAAFYDLMRGRRPFVTFGLMAINIFIYLLLYTNGNPSDPRTLIDSGALVPRLIEQGQWWRLATSMFLHASVAHILFNMTSLFAVGTLAERLYGSAKYLAIYLGSGLIGSLVSFSYAVGSGNNLDVPGVGASGAIFGVAGCLLTVAFQRSEIIPQRLRTRVSSSLLPLVVISLVFSFLTPYVDNGAHIGGLLGGIGLSFLFPLDERLPDRT